MSQRTFDELRARAVAPEDAEQNAFVVSRDDVSIEVRCTEGSSPALGLSAAYPNDAATAAHPGYRDPARERLRAVRPMMLSLRGETASDRHAKAAGVAVEAQTGDAAFDARVYVLGPSSQEVVRAVLGPSPRAAVGRLLDLGFSSIEIDDEQGKVRAVCPAPSRLVGRTDDVLDAFTALVRALPKVDASGEAHPIDTERRMLVGAGLAAGVGICLASGAAVASTPRQCMGEGGDGPTVFCDFAPYCCEAPEKGAAVGLIAGLALAVVLARRIRGRPDSHVRRRWMIAIVAVLGLELGVILAALLR